MSRTVNGEVLFGDREREVFRKMIWKVADFSGVRVITYAIMKNHFHLLVEVPHAGIEVSDEELVRRYRVLYPKPTPWQPMCADALKKRLAVGGAERDQSRAAILKRMSDVSEFMKTLKQRFSLWFNASKDRFGPLWADRFKSVLVEGDYWALRTVAAYIDLNPVRAGLVDDPKDYRFCGYGEAVGGGRAARAGIMMLGRDLSDYRKTLFGAGVCEKTGRSSIHRDDAAKVLAEGREDLPLGVVLRCRLKYMTDGIVLGRKDFVESRLEAIKTRGKRPARARPMRGAQWRGLSIGRGMKKDLFS